MSLTKKIVIAGAVCLGACGEAKNETVLSCRGTVEIIRAGEQINMKDEPSSIVVVVNIEKKTLKMISGIFEDEVPITSVLTQPSEDTILASSDKGIVSLNRITGAINLHLNRFVGTPLSERENFYGRCEPSHRMF